MNSVIIEPRAVSITCKISMCSPICTRQRVCALYTNANKHSSHYKLIVVCADRIIICNNNGENSEEVTMLVQKKDLSFDRSKQACYIYCKISVIISQLSNFVNS